MTPSLILIEQDPQIAEAYTAMLQQNSSVDVETSTSQEETLEKAEELEPDLILLATNYKNHNCINSLKKLRKLKYITRPVIIIVDNSEVDDHTLSIKAIQAGADDYIKSTISEEEFSARMFAHLRRHIEEQSDSFTLLPGSKIINTNIKRKINQQTRWSLMILSLNNYCYYQETYGDLAANQLLKAFIAIVKANISNEDFFGHIGNEDFALITNPLKAELIAEHICKTIDSIIPKFYAPFEADRGFTIHTDEERASIKIPLVSVSIGIVSNSYRHINDYKTALSIASNMKDLSRKQLYSGWLIDRPLLAGDEFFVAEKEPAYIIVVEADAALAYLLTTTLEMQGYDVDATSNKDDAISFLHRKKPDLILIDAAIPGDDGWEICSFVKENDIFKNTRIIMATAHHDKEKALSAGADLYIPKPYELISLHKWINRLILMA
jgi:DNA-binding response OmpR family regulator